MNKGPIIVKPNLSMFFYVRLHYKIIFKLGTMNILLELTRHDRADSSKTAAMVMREITHLGFSKHL